MKIKTTHICKTFADNKVLQDISISVNTHEVVSILGASGCGKTTLFNIISGLLPPDEGQIFINDTDITAQTGHIGYMLQKDLLLPFRTIIDNVILPLLIKKEKKSLAYEKAIPYFEAFGLTDAMYRYPHELSGGMRQRAALLRTLLFSNDILLLDEPFSALDAITKSELHRWFLEILQNIPLTVIFITHDIDEALFLSDRIYILKGKPATVTSELKIAKPNNINFLLSPQFLEYKKSILSLLED